MSNLRLLLVEDSEGDAGLIVRVLTQAGFEVAFRRVDDADGLRHALDNSAWDVIVADYRLPAFDAPGVLRMLREWGEDIPCIVVSGEMGEETAVAMMKAGARDYLTKNNLARLAPAVYRELTEAAERRRSRHAREELWQAGERLALAVEATQFGTFDFHLQSGKLVWSNNARRHFGLLSETEVTYESFVRALHPADRDGAVATFQNALRYENGGTYAHEYRTVGLEDGRERCIASCGRVFFDQDRRPVRVLGVTQDITERKRLEEQLTQSQKMESVGRLAGCVADEFKNLLNVINTHAHAVLAQMDSEDMHRNPMEEISRAALQATELTRQLVSFSSPHPAEPQMIGVNEFIKSYENMLRRLMGERVQLVLRLDPEAGAFRAAPGQLEQVLMNLAVNAKDAMPAGGTLSIDTGCVVVDEHFAHDYLHAAPGCYVVLSVTDTGVGMSAEVKSHLFESFYTTKERGKGTGLGLSTVQAIVKQSNGCVLVASELGRGTSFDLFFPYCPEADGAAVRNQRLTARGQTILLADEEAGVRKYAREVLERYGYGVLEASSGPEALALAKDHPGSVDLLLTEILMPMPDGAGLAAKFAAERPRTPVLLMSSYSQESISLPDPLSAYLPKPFALSGLLTQVRGLLERGAALMPTQEIAASIGQNKPDSPTLENLGREHL